MYIEDKELKEVHVCSFCEQLTGSDHDLNIIFSNNFDPSSLLEAMNLKYTRKEDHYEVIGETAFDTLLAILMSKGWEPVVPSYALIAGGYRAWAFAVTKPK